MMPDKANGEPCATAIFLLQEEAQSYARLHQDTSCFSLQFHQRNSRQISVNNLGDWAD